jgi:hypothetical protein
MTEKLEMREGSEVTARSMMVVVLPRKKVWARGAKTGLSMNNRC